MEQQKEKLVFECKWDYVIWKRRNRKTFHRSLQDVSTGKIYVGASTSRKD